MTLDLEMAEIAKVFFQESREGLDVMESGLLSLGATADPENINTIFRAAHSIKGGSATFGFAEVADFTHGVETLLDEMRNGVREVTTEAIQALLQSCDCLREMIAATEAEQPLDQGRIASLKNEINRILSERNGEPLSHAPAPTVPAPIDDAADPGATGWRIVFQPVPISYVCAMSPLDCSPNSSAWVNSPRAPMFPNYRRSMPLIRSLAISHGT